MAGTCPRLDIDIPESSATLQIDSQRQHTEWAGIRCRLPAGRCRRCRRPMWPKRVAACSARAALLPWHLQACEEHQQVARRPSGCPGLKGHPWSLWPDLHSALRNARLHVSRCRSSSSAARRGGSTCGAPRELRCRQWRRRRRRRGLAPRVGAQPPALPISLCRRVHVQPALRGDGAAKGAALPSQARWDDERQHLL